ncbi:MAG: sn-glycerol-3-phosphate ABC transporter ATP-binding protein UgpC [Cyanobacteria bacterium P01_F01_bin.86]
MAQVVLENITKTFANGPKPTISKADNQAGEGDSSSRPVLQQINLTVNDGEFMVLVGPSGCGKSTLLRLISGLETLTEGTIQVGDRTVNTLPPKQRDIAMVFQSYALYPHLSVYNNLAFGLRRSRPRKSKIEIAKRVQSVATMLQIEDLLERLPKQLSGGQKQRVALGRAMARNPQVFLMDEPLSNLDAKLRTETRAQIVDLQHQLGITTIYVTHDQTEAMTMGDRIAVMNQGQLNQVAPPLELYRHPANLFVAAFIGSPPMNFLSVSVRAGQLTHPAFTLALSEAWQQVIAPYSNQYLTLGIRPEHISVGKTPKAFPVTVTQLEALGSETFVMAQLSANASDTTDNFQIQIRISADQPVEKGSTLQISFPPDKIHLFDPTSDLAIRPVN